MKRLQKILHPDKFSTRSETERARSADQAQPGEPRVRRPSRSSRAPNTLRGRGEASREDEGFEGGERRGGSHRPRAPHGGDGDPRGDRGGGGGRGPGVTASTTPSHRRRSRRERGEQGRRRRRQALDGGDATLDAARRATVELTYLARACGRRSRRAIVTRASWARGRAPSRAVARPPPSGRGEARASVRLRPSSRVSSTCTSEGHLRPRREFRRGHRPPAFARRRGVRFAVAVRRRCPIATFRPLEFCEWWTPPLVSSSRPTRVESSTTRSVRCCRRSIACELSSRTPTRRLTALMVSSARLSPSPAPSRLRSRQPPPPAPTLARRGHSPSSAPRSSRAPPSSSGVPYDSHRPPRAAAAAPP